MNYIDIYCNQLDAFSYLSEDLKILDHLKISIPLG